MKLHYVFSFTILTIAASVAFAEVRAMDSKWSCTGKFFNKGEEVHQLKFEGPKSGNMIDTEFRLDNKNGMIRFIYNQKGKAYFSADKQVEESAAINIEIGSKKFNGDVFYAVDTELPENFVLRKDFEFKNKYYIFRLKCSKIANPK